MELQRISDLDMATGAMTRRDYLTAMQFGLRAASVPKGQEDVRCDAYLLLALTSLELGLGEDALSFAVGAHLTAVWAGDCEREARAASIVSLVVTQYPRLSADDTLEIH